MAIKMNQTNGSCSTQFGRILSLYVSLLLWYIPLGAQQIIPIRGTVFSVDDGGPLVGISVHVEGASVGVVIDIDRGFVLETAFPARLKFSYVGFQAATIEVRESNSVKLFMKPDTHSLDEVMIVGCGAQKKKLITGTMVQVKGDDIAKLDTASIFGTLRSQAPGVSTISSSGMPSEGPKVTTHGLGTTGSTEPLYIIDGITDSDINAPNPGDIESINVLKNAALAAIYGGRAADSAILVTTKQGRKGKLRIGYDGYMGWQNVHRMPDFLNAQEYASVMNEAHYTDDLSALNFATPMPDQNKTESREWKGTNWLDETLNKSAIVPDQSPNIAGETDQFIYSLSLSYTEQNSITGKPVTPVCRRYSVRIDSGHILTKSGNLNVFSVDENSTCSYSERSSVSIDSMQNNGIRNLLHSSPFFPNLSSDGSYRYAIPWESCEPNPIGLMDYTGRQNFSKIHGLQVNFYAQLELMKGLRLKSNFGYRLSASTDRSFIPRYKLVSNSSAIENQVDQSLNTGNALLWENMLSYKARFGRHSIDALVGQPLEKNRVDEGIYGSNYNSILGGFKHAYLNNTPVATGCSQISGWSQGIDKLASFFDCMNYDYDGKYMITTVVRANGSSNFTRGHR